jgi:hypothetical protein
MIEIDVIDSGFLKDLLVEIESAELSQWEVLLRVNVHEQSHGEYRIGSVLLSYCWRKLKIDLSADKNANWDDYVAAYAEQKQIDWMLAFREMMEYIIQHPRG